MEVKDKEQNQKPFTGSRIMLFRSRGNPKIFNLRTMSGDGKGEVTFTNVVGPNGHQMMGYLNEKSGHISLFESDPNRVSKRESTNKSMSIGNLLSAMKSEKVLV